jgi:hypothetical protein
MPRSDSYFKPGESHPNWKGGPGKLECIDCAARLSSRTATRCRSCEAKIRTGKGSGPNYPNCLDCGIKLKDHRSKRCRVCANKGERAAGWRGGVSGVNKALRGSYQFRQWREAVFSRDDYTCQMCGIRGGKIHPDHIMPFAYYPELRFDISNGRTLCAPCHYKTPTYGAKALRYKVQDKVISPTV